MTTAYADKEVSFSYTYSPLSGLEVKTKEDPKTGKAMVESIGVKGEFFTPTQRFWTSLFSRYGFNKAFFNYFGHAEVFARIASVKKDDQLRLCIEEDDKGGGKLLAVSNPNKPVVVFDEYLEIIKRYNGSDITYSDGIVESIHSPHAGATRFMVGPDEFANRFLLATAIDGYGAPNIYLTLLRQKYETAIIGYTKDFRGTLALGKGDDDVGPTITRALDGFGNEEGFSALRLRLESSVDSWVSVYEALQLQDLMTRCHGARLINDKVLPRDARDIRNYYDRTLNKDDELGCRSLIAFHTMTDNMSSTYGMANLNQLNQKRQRSLPVNCSMFDFLLFASEVASCISLPTGSRMMHTRIGTVMATEYDMENTKRECPNFHDFVTGAKLSAGVTG